MPIPRLGEIKQQRPRYHRQHEPSYSTERKKALGKQEFSLELPSLSDYLPATKVAPESYTDVTPVLY
jgi:hypothetical protein